MLSIDSDAHKTAEFDHLRWGITQARRAWVEPRRRAQHALARRPPGLGRRQAGRACDDAARSRTIARDAPDRLDVGGPPRPRARRGHRRRPVARSSSRPASGSSRSSCSGRCSLGSLQVLGDEARTTDGHGLGIPIESLILPAVAAVACVGAIRLVPFGLRLVPGARCVTGLIVERCLALEARILASPTGSTTTAGRRSWSRPCIVGVPRVRRRRGHRPGRARPAGHRAARPAARCRGATCSSWPPATRASRSCSATGRPRCAYGTAARRAVVGGRPTRSRSPSRPRRCGAIADPAAAGPGAADAVVLPVGRVPRGDARRAAATSAGCGRRSCSRSSASWSSA